MHCVFETAAVAPVALRLLRPAPALRRFRAVRLGSLAHALEEQRRSARVVALAVEHFPAQVSNLHGDWDDLLREFLWMVEKAGWFEIDWETLDNLYDAAMQQGIDDDEQEVPWLSDLASYTLGVPVKFYNYDEEDWLNDAVVDEYPALLALRAGVDPDFSCDGAAELESLTWINWDAALAAIDWPAQPEPLCWLPLAVRYCRRGFGLPLLDDGVCGFDLWPERYTWAGDIDRLWSWSLVARPIWAAIEALAKWLDDGDHVEQLTALLSDDEEDDNDDDI